MTRRPILLAIAILLASPGTRAAETRPALNEVRVLAVGFGPFGGRKNNGSSLAAAALAGTRAGASVSAIEVPVVWGEPKRVLTPLVKEKRPAILLCLGEGAPGFFTLEAVARNTRRPIPDVRGDLPPAPQSEVGGPDEIPATAPVLALAKALTEKGFATHVSTDAGGYLCNEMLYTAERLKAQNTALELVLFAHLPPQGQVAFAEGRAVKTNPELVKRFAQALLSLARKTVARERARR